MTVKNVGPKLRELAFAAMGSLNAVWRNQGSTIFTILVDTRTNRQLKIKVTEMPLNCIFTSSECCTGQKISSTKLRQLHDTCQFDDWLGGLKDDGALVGIECLTFDSVNKICRSANKSYITSVWSRIFCSKNHVRVFNNLSTKAFMRARAVPGHTNRKLIGYTGHN